MKVKSLADELASSRNECEKQTKLNSIMQINIKALMNKLDSLKSENRNLNSKNSEMAEKTKVVEQEKEELEQFLEESNALNKEQMKKSEESFRKLQETIKVAESAMAEVEQLSNEKRLIEDELNHLSKTIGSVIEDAAEKVDKRMVEAEAKHQHEMDKLKLEIEHLKQMVELEKTKTTSAMHQAKTFEEKLHSIDTTNSFLDHDLKNAIQTIVRY